MQLNLLIKLTMLSMVFTACEQASESSPSTSSTANVTFQSAPYTNDGTVALFTNPSLKKIQNFFLPLAYADVVSDFQFCITKLKVVSSVDGAAGASQEAKLGTVDVSSSTTTQNWGTIAMADGAVISEVHFEVHKDPELCGGDDFSVSYEGQTITKDLEFKFKFDPAVKVSNGKTLTLGLGKIAKAMETAKLATKFNDIEIGAYMEATVVGTGSED
ncbi:MAG: hypothetical protein HON90_08835 [Halobacteriovoraceae bacterium]|jgi:hypothetical protein|nr:hypothetical protein [Halobacteriovoraceae bacterium]